MYEMSEELIIGRNPVVEALKSGRSVNKVMVAEQVHQRTQRQLEELSKKAGTIVQRVPKSRLTQLSDGNHQGVVAYVAAYQYASLENLFERADECGEAPFFIILDELEDPHNLGSILRNVHATGAHGVIIQMRRSVGLYASLDLLYAGDIDHI